MTIRSGFDDIAAEARFMRRQKNESFTGLVSERCSNGDKVAFGGGKGIDDPGVEIDAFPFEDDRPGFVVRKSRFIDPLTDERILDISDAHQSTRQWNVFSAEAFGIAAAVPLLVVGQCNLPGILQKGVAAQR
jgi:hypothetical protein